jgi:hypothetical protein
MDQQVRRIWVQRRRHSWRSSSMLIHQRRLKEGRLPTTNRPALAQAQAQALAQAQAQHLALTTAGIQHMDARVMLTLVRPLILVLTPILVRLLVLAASSGWMKLNGSII